MPVNLPVFSTRRQQSIRIYTDEPEVVSEVSQKPIALESDGSTIVQLSVKTFKTEQKDVVVNCVDVRTQHVTKAYLLQIKSDKPIVKQSFVVKCVLKKENWEKLPIENPFDHELDIELASSNPDLVTPVKPKLRLPPNSTINAVFYFTPSSRKTKKEAYIFVNEALKEKSRFNHSYHIEITYKKTEISEKAKKDK